MNMNTLPNKQDCQTKKYIMTKKEILARLDEVNSEMDYILDLPDEFQTDDMWEYYSKLESEYNELERELEKYD